jgi:hypothetical protein
MTYKGYEISIDMKNMIVQFDDGDCHIVNYDFSHFDCDNTDNVDDVEIAVKEWLAEYPPQG